MDLFYLLSVFPVALAIVMLVVYIDERNIANAIKADAERNKVLHSKTQNYNTYPQQNKQDYAWDVQSFFG